MDELKTEKLDCIEYTSGLVPTRFIIIIFHQISTV